MQYLQYAHPSDTENVFVCTPMCDLLSACGYVGIEAYKSTAASTAGGAADNDDDDDDLLE